MLPKLTKPVLILNKNWTAIGTAPVYKVLNLLLSGPPKAEVIDETCVPYTWEEWSKIRPPIDSEEAIHTVNYIFRIPEIIKLNKTKPTVKLAS